MRKIRIVLVAAIVANIAIALVAEAKGLLPCMVYRRGLTNEQIDQILAAHPDAQLRITAHDWRGMQYQLLRFGNMTNYVEQIGGSNDCARVLLELHDAAENWKARHGAVSNLYVLTEMKLATETERAQEYANAYAEATNRIADVTADYMSASNRAARAEAHTAALVTWAEELRDNATLPPMKALWQTFIDRIKQED